MPRVFLDCAPDVVVECDALGPEWNGWTVPLWRDVQACAGALRAVLAGLESVTPLDFHVYVLDVDTIMICPDDPTSEDDLIPRGADGMLSLEGWVFHTA